MVLLVRDGCDFCEGLKDVPGLIVFKVVRDAANQQKVQVGDKLLDPPFKVQALPALLDNQDLYMGRDLIVKHLKEKGCLAA